MRAEARKHIRRIFSYIRRTGSTSRSASQCAEAAASGSRGSCRGDRRSSAAETPPAVWTAGRENKRSSYAAIYEKESHYTGKRPPGGASAAGNIEGDITPDAPADQSGGPDFPSRPARTFCVQTGETRQNGADKRVANRPQKAAFPSLRRAADDPPKAEQKRRFTAQKTVQKPSSGGKPSRESGCSEIDGTLLRPRPRPPLSRRAETAVRARRNLSRGVGFWRKTLDNKVSLC